MQIVYFSNGSSLQYIFETLSIGVPEECAETTICEQHTQVHKNRRQCSLRKRDATNTFLASRIYISVTLPISKTWQPLRRPCVKSGQAGRWYPLHYAGEDVFEVARDLERVNPDLTLTVTTQSVATIVKVASLAYSDIAFTAKHLEAPSVKSERQAPGIQRCQIHVINVPTCPSRGEYTAVGWATNITNDRKVAFGHPSMMPNLVVLGGDECGSTPEDPMLSSRHPRYGHLRRGKLRKGYIRGKRGLVTL